MTSPLETVFESHVPQMLRVVRTPTRPVVCVFRATGGPEVGAWRVSLADNTSTPVAADDDADVTIEASATTLVLFFAGQLNVSTLVKRGLLSVRGDATALRVLSDALRTA